jgi:hypothetical protein
MVLFITTAVKASKPTGYDMFICAAVGGWMKNLENHFKEQEEQWMQFSHHNLLLKFINETCSRFLRPHVALLSDIDSVAMHFALIG